jgi:hypothetical protein
LSGALTLSTDNISGESMKLTDRAYEPAVADDGVKTIILLVKLLKRAPIAHATRGKFLDE